MAMSMDRGHISSKGAVKMPAFKHQAYAELVQARKACALCDGLKNPAAICGRKFDSEHIGPWSRWQGNLDAELMVIGQDWGNVKDFCDQKGTEVDNNSTNKTLMELLNSIGFEIDLPSAMKGFDAQLFFTNAILCLKDSEKLHIQWYKNCGAKFLKPIIELIQPKVVVTLGTWALQAVQKEFGLWEISLKDIIKKDTAGFPLNDTTRLIAVYHPSPRVINSKIRTLEQQKSDWKRIHQALVKIP
jgi:uracil-DNA glycosylase family 4